MQPDGKPRPARKSLTEERLNRFNYLKNARSLQSLRRAAPLQKSHSEARRGIGPYASILWLDPVATAERVYARLLKEGVLTKGKPLEVLDVGYGVFAGDLFFLLKRKKIPVKLTVTNVYPLGVGRVRSGEPAFSSIASQSIHYAEKLDPFWTNRFHLVFSCNALSYAADKVAAVNEVNRVLHPLGFAALHLGDPGLLQGTIREDWTRAGLKVVHWHNTPVVVHFNKLAAAFRPKLSSFKSANWTGQLASKYARSTNK